jgi:hypothetical protein
LKSRWVHFVPSGYSGAGGRFPAIFAMPVLPIVMAIGRDGRGTTLRGASALLRRRLTVRLSAAAQAKTGSELDSPSSRVLHEISGLVRLEVLCFFASDEQHYAAILDWPLKRVPI